jgi:hypothetical protein
MSDSSNGTSGGVGFAGLLTVAFVVLKLAHFIAWSWWWVLSPLWISAGVGIAILLIVGVVMAGLALAGRRQ